MINDFTEYRNSVEPILQGAGFLLQAPSTINMPELIVPSYGEALLLVRQMLAQLKVHLKTFQTKIDANCSQFGLFFNHIFQHNIKFDGTVEQHLNWFHQGTMIANATRQLLQITPANEAFKETVRNRKVALIPDVFLPPNFGNCSNLLTFFPSQTFI